MGSVSSKQAPGGDIDGIAEAEYTRWKHLESTQKNIPRGSLCEFVGGRSMLLNQIMDGE